MRRKAGLTLAEHQQLGLEVAMARLILLRATVKLGNKYPQAAKHVKLAEAGRKALEKLQCELDNVVCAQFPSATGVEAARIYYGRSEDADAALQQLQAIRVKAAT